MRVTTNQHSILLIVAFAFCSSTVQAAQVTLWATVHDDRRDICSEEINQIANLVEEHPEEIGIDHFIFAPETKANLTSTNVIGLDDPVLGEYVRLYVYSRKALNLIAYDFESGNTEFEEYETYIQALSDFLLFFSKPDLFPNLYPIAQEIIQRDQDSEYMKAIREDLDLTRDDELIHLIQENGPLNPYNQNTTSTLQLKSGLIRILYNHFANIESAYHLPIMRSVISSYVVLTRNIAIEYFNRKIKPYPPYGFTIHRSGSLYDGASTLDVGKGEYLFANNNYFNQYDTPEKVEKYYNQAAIDETEIVATVYWRDPFIAQNIVKLMETYKDASILAWVGDGHTAGVTKHLMNSSLKEKMKKKINVISMSTDRNLACDYAKVLDLVKNPKASLSLPVWYQQFNNP